MTVNLFNLSLKLSGFPIEEGKRQLETILAIPESEYEGFVEKSKNEIVAFHLRQNSFFRDLNGSGTFTSWNDLPILTKKDLQKPLAERLSDNYPDNKVFVSKTSGSGGTPFIFAKDKPAHALSWASTIHLFGQYGIDFNKSLQARFYGIPLDFVGYWKERLKDFLGKRYRFPVFDLSDIALEGMLKKFQHTKFEYINGYTSSMVLFAKFLRKSNVVLKDVCPTLKVCMATSEMLFESDRELLEVQFGIPVVNEYGASELGIIAFENPGKEWQVNAETLFVEIVDDNNQPVPNGKEGRVVITSLFNKAHPFIRYDIGDIGVLDEKSTFKKPILKQLIGRTNDVALLPSGKKSPGLTFYYVTKSIIEDDGNVKEFVIRQTTMDTFEVDYTSEKELSENQIKKIEAAIALYLEPGLRFTFVRKPSLARSSSGKLKQFRSML